MPLVLADWFAADLKTHSIPIDDVDSAKLTVDFKMNGYGQKKGPRIAPEFKLISNDNVYSLIYKGEHGINEVNVT